jgi:hypothetical protein
MSKIENSSTTPVHIREEWEAHLTRQKTSGLNQSEYCRLNGLKVYQFSYWKKKIQSPWEGEQNFIRLPVETPSITAGVPLLNISVDGDFRLKINLNFSGEHTWRLF